MISTTCRDECPAGSSVSAGSGPSGPGGGDGVTTEAGFFDAFLPTAAAFGLGFDPDFFLERSDDDEHGKSLLGFDGATFLRASPVLAHPERGSSGWSFLRGTAVPPLAATSSTAMDLQWRDRTQLPAAAVGRRPRSGGFSGITRGLEMRATEWSLWLTAGWWRGNLCCVGASDTFVYIGGMVLCGYYTVLSYYSTSADYVAYLARQHPVIVWFAGCAAG